MPERQYVDRVVGWRVAVQRGVAGIAETDDQLTQFRLIRERSTCLWRGLQLVEASIDRYGRPFRGLRILGRQKIAAAVQLCDRASRDDYPWHSGGSALASVPQLFSQSRTSSRVRCCPVS